MPEGDEPRTVKAAAICAERGHRTCAYCWVIRRDQPCCSVSGCRTGCRD
ncbi:hypothetical protein ACLB1M_18370 [Escherichia coli]